MIVALSGPMLSLVLAIIFSYINCNLNNKQEAVYSNIIIILFNLLPIYPLDCGRIVKEIIMIKDGTKLAYEKINNISKVTVIIITIITSIIILKIHNIAILIILTYLWYLNIKNEKEYKVKCRIISAVKGGHVDI